MFERAPGENVGTYAITPSGLTSANYTVTFLPAVLSISPVALTVTAESKAKTYGAVDPAFNVVYAGFANGETAAALGGTLVFTRAPGENVGTYAITPSGLTSANYTITFLPATLSISPVALTVTAEAKTKPYGATDPAFTVVYAGFANGETAATLSGTLVFTRAPGENVGTYAITPSGLTSANYAITYIPGDLLITSTGDIPVALSITSDLSANILIVWNSVSNVTYRVQYKSSLVSASWTDLPGDVVATDKTASKADARTSTSRFYRVQVAP